MAKKYLDYDGVLYFWQKIKNVFVPATRTVNGNALSANVILSASDVGAAPTSHDSTSTTYGKGTSSKYGHVKLSDSTTSTTAATSGGTAATPKAVKDALDAAKEYADGIQAGVSDVKLNDTSVVTEGVANIYDFVPVNGSRAAEAGLVPATDGGHTTTDDIRVFTDSGWVSLSSDLDSSSKYPAKSYAISDAITASYNKAKIGGLYTAYKNTNANSYYISGERSDRGLSFTNGMVIAVKFMAANNTGTSASEVSLAFSGPGTTHTNYIPVRYGGAIVPYNAIIAERTLLLMYNSVGPYYEIIGSYYNTVGLYNSGILPPVGMIGETGEYKIYDGYTGSWLTVAPYLDSTSDAPPKSRVVASALNGKISTSQIGAASGVCPLNASTKIDATYLPSYVDDVIEAYPVSGATELSVGWLSETSGGSALTPETGKIYILMADTASYAANTQFRWSGTTYVKLADGGVSSITNGEIDTIIAS